MANKNVLHAQGTRFQRNSGVEWQDISQIKDITPPAKTRTEIETTTIDQYDGSEPDPHKTYVGGLIDGGSVSLDMIFDPDELSNQRVIDADIEAENPIEYRILYRNGSMWTFFGVAKEMTMTNPMDDICRQTVGIKVSGKPVYTFAS